MALTKEEWEQIERDIVFMPGFVKLLIDGFKIQLSRVHNPKNKLITSILIYVNGEISGKWVIEKEGEDPLYKDIRNKFLRKRTSRISTIGNLRKKGFRKREAEKFIKKYTHVAYDVSWTSFRSLKSHLIRNNKEISLCKEEDSNENN
jgi:hypothetical protein